MVGMTGVLVEKELWRELWSERRGSSAHCTYEEGAAGETLGHFQ